LLCLGAASTAALTAATEGSIKAAELNVPGYFVLPKAANFVIFFLNLHQEFIGELIRKKLAPEDRSVTDDDLAIVEFVCKLLSERCALLVCSTFMCDPVTILLCDFVTVTVTL
jgi:hypothetical protein